MEAKTHILNVFQKLNLFNKINVVSNQKHRRFKKDLNELVSLQDQVKAVRLQDKLGKENFHEDLKKFFEPVTKSLDKASQDITKTITETSIKNNKAISDLNEKKSRINE